MIVEDDYQGRGIGTRLLRHMLELAERIGFREVVAVVLAQNDEMLRLLEATSLDWTRTVEEAVLTLRAPLPVVEAGSLSPARPSLPRASRKVQSDGVPTDRPPEKKSRKRS